MKIEFKIQQEIGGEWNILYRKKKWYSFFIRTVKTMDHQGNIQTATFAERYLAELFLWRMQREFKSLNHYHQWLLAEANRRKNK